ncbi:MAG TPA: DUF1697 domain-containing protein [Candidatus Saccharimonadales bacterium]|nr:DUF1697 domain-containing protein [Candidatus Saccharimonadales bacterium]
MSKYAALLRGVNVGGRIIKMAELKDCLAQIGLSDVRTVLQSGNVVFKSDLPASRLKADIEAKLADAFNYPAKAWVKPASEISQIVDSSPFSQAGKDYHQYVIFFEDGLEKDFASEAGSLPEPVQAGQGVVYWQVLKGQTLKSPVAKLLAKAKYKSANTNRNINTLLKLI